MASIEIYAKPMHLYRYRPLGEHAQREVDALEGGYIYCPSFADMNDPLEATHRMSARYLKNPRADKRQAEILTALQTMEIASMSEVNNHEPMWAHYADRFRGICIEYNMSRLLKGLVGPDIAITRMMYSEREPVLLDQNSTPRDRARLCLSSKTIRWSSEREWRIFSDQKGPVSYDQEKTATKIFLGSRISNEDENLVRAAAANLKVPVFKMIIESYSIAFESKPMAKTPLPKPPRRQR